MFLKRKKLTYYCKIEAEVFLQQHQSESNQKQKQLTEQGRQAEEIRNLAMEGLSESKKRMSVDDESPKSKRNKGSETLCYLRNKYEQDTALREKEI